MLAATADFPAIYVPGPVDDAVLCVKLTDVSESWQGSSIYFEPLKTRCAALLNALIASGTGTAEAIADAATFLELLPLDVPDPEILIEDDGQIGLDWRVGNRSLSLNFGKDGMIGYSAIFDSESAYGRAPFTGTELPARIASLLRGLAAERQNG